ncbi:AQJ64_40280 family protein [Streptomyces sp. NPDC096191]|uniref:AQJ64_40280 family protein n=1 Tax=Streptomyces sp. NPDC096191 TaxID=3155426 RepID=UPI0033311844
MTELHTTVTWVDVRERLPRAGHPVAAAITGRYPAEATADAATARRQEFWLVRTMYFTDRHHTEDGEVHSDCFVDSDGVVRFPHDPDSDDSVTHWAELPTLPGEATHLLLGDDVRPALRRAWNMR